MLLPLALKVTAALISGWILAAIIEVWVREARASDQPSVFPHRQVSLCSLIFFLFFPEFNAPSSPESSLPPRELD